VTIETIEVVTCAVAKLNIDWLAEKQESDCENKLDEHFLPSKTRPPSQACLSVQTSTLRCLGRGKNPSPHVHPEQAQVLE